MKVTINMRGRLEDISTKLEFACLSYSPYDERTTCPVGLLIGCPFEEQKRCSDVSYKDWEKWIESNKCSEDN